MEMMNDRFVEITKAYKALTDEEIRNNYIQYGHPDGKQSFSIGIALPQFIVTEGNGKYVLLVYGGLLGVLLPYIVGKWWYGSQRYTKEKVIVASAGRIFREYNPDITPNGVINAVSSGEEYNHMFEGVRAESGLAKVEQKVTAEAEKDAGLSPKDAKVISELENPARRKALALLWAYLARIELDDPALDSGMSFPSTDPVVWKMLMLNSTEKYEVASTAVQLVQSFRSIALSFGLLQPILAALQTPQYLIQAMVPGASPLLQLPHFSPKVVEAIEGDHAKEHMTVQQYMELAEAQRKKISVGPGLLSDKQYQTAVTVARQIPDLQICKAFFKVVGEKVVTPSSLVRLVVKARFIPPGYKNVPEVSASDLEDVDPDEDDISGNRKAKGEDEEDETVQPPLAHAPYFARDHVPQWQFFLADVRSNRMAVPPFTFSSFDKPIIDDKGKPTFNVQTLRMQFQAPPQQGNFNFVLFALCDSYVGFDSARPITLSVDDLAKAAALEDEDEISEPDEGM
jgi:translocation protein SEC63